MRTVLNNHEIAHVWAHAEDRRYARSNSQTLRSGRMLMSYAEPIGWWGYVTLPNDPQPQRLYLLTSQTWSVTTSRHQSRAARAIPPGVVEVYLADNRALSAVWSADSEERDSVAIAALTAELTHRQALALEAYESAQAVAHYKPTNATRYKREREAINAIAHHDELARLLVLPTIQALADDDTKRNLDAIRAARDAQRAREAREEQARREQWERDFAERLAAHEVDRQRAIRDFRDGLPLSNTMCANLRRLSEDYRDPHPDLARLTPAGGIETSRWSTVEPRHARRVMLAIQSIVGAIDSGVSLVDIPLPQELGGYSPIQWDDETTLAVGCHRFSVDELRHFATLSLPSPVTV